MVSVGLNDRIKTFYLLEELWAELPRKESKFIGVDKLLRDLKEEREEHNTELAALLKDYLLITTIGEGRHGEFYCYKPFQLELDGKPIVKGNFSRSTSYDKILAVAPKIDPHVCLSWLLCAFNRRIWASSFGGEAWGTIVETALLFFTTPKEIFIDTVINLQHNNGSVLTKTVPFMDCNLVTLKEFLDDRAETRFSFFTRKNRWDNLQTGYGVRVPGSIFRLVQRAVALQLLSEEEISAIFRSPNSRVDYSPIKWGEGIVIMRDLTERDELQRAGKNTGAIPGYHNPLPPAPPSLKYSVEETMEVKIKPTPTLHHHEEPAKIEPEGFDKLAALHNAWLVSEVDKQTAFNKSFSQKVDEIKLNTTTKQQDPIKEMVEDDDDIPF